MTPDFNALDTATWPTVMTVEMVAAIYFRTVPALKKACARHRFLPAHYKTRPYLWRRSDVLRDIEGSRQLRRVG